MSPRILLVRPGDDGDRTALESLGLQVVHEPYLQVRPCDDDGAAARAEDLLEALSAPDAWLILASANGIGALGSLAGASQVSRRLASAAQAGARFAAVGPTSARALHRLGIADVRTPTRQHTAAALLDLLGGMPAGLAVLPRSDIADSVLPDTLSARGWRVCARVVYRTATVVDRPVSAAALQAGGFEALVLRSPSAVHAVVHHAQVPATTRIIAGGPTTALAAVRAGLTVTTVAEKADADGIAAAVGRAFESRRVPA